MESYDLQSVAELLAGEYVVNSNRSVCVIVKLELYQRKKENNIMFRTIRKKKNEISTATAKTNDIIQYDFFNFDFVII